MANVAMACIVMAEILWPSASWDPLGSRARNRSYGLTSYGLYSYGLVGSVRAPKHSYGLKSYGVYRHGLNSYGLLPRGILREAGHQNIVMA